MSDVVVESPINFQAEPRRLIVVLGMHRSGTSVLAMGLQVLGVSLGTDLEPAVAGVNDKGFWEDIEFNAINTELLHFLGHDWHTLHILTEAELNRDDLAPYRQRAEQLLRDRLSRYAVFGLKNPRVCILLPFWQKIFSALGLEVTFVVAFRHPASVVRSLARRDGFASAKGYYLWLEHMVFSVLATAGTRRVVVDYDRLMERPEPELCRLAQALGFSRDDAFDARLVEFSHDFLDPDLRHSRFADTEVLYQDPAVPAEVVQAHDLLLRMSTEEPAAASQELQAAWLELAGRLRDMAPVFDFTDALGRDLHVARVQAADLSVQVVACQEDIELKRQHLLGCQADLESNRQHLLESQGEVASLLEHKAALEMNLKELVSLVSELRQEVDAYRSSTSWRVTRPLRAVGHWLSRVRRLLWLVKDHRRRHPGFAGLARMTGRMASAARRGGVPGVMQAIRNYSHFRSALMQVPAPQMAGQQVAVDVLLPDAGPAILPAGGLAVHVHAYYVDLLPELCGYLSNLPGPFQLFVTTDTEAKAHEILGIVAGRGWQAHADVRVVENRGRDTAPMLVSLGPELSRFGVVLHVHTKKSPHNHELRGWRSFLLTALLGSKEGVSAILRRFAQDEDLGLLFPAPYLPVQPFMHMGGNREFAAELLARADCPGYALDAIDERFFPAGGMFWVRGRALQRLVDLNLGVDDFAEEAGQDDATLAHAIERMFPYFAGLEGFSSRSFLPQSMHAACWPGALPLDSEGLQRFVSGPASLIFDHNIGGGTNRYSREWVLDRASRYPVVRVFHAQPAWVVQVVSEDSGMFFASVDRDQVFACLQALPCREVVVNSLYGMPEVDRVIEAVIQLSMNLAAPLECMVHDFFMICPSQHLLGADERYCGVPEDTSVCDRCLRDNPAAAWCSSRAPGITEWRQPFAGMLAAASTVTVFDASGADLLQKTFGPMHDRLRVSPHSDAYFDGRSPRLSTQRMNIGVFGTLTTAKGGAVVNELARYIRGQGLDARLTVVGRSLVELDADVLVTGAYATSDLPEIVEEQEINVCLVASIVPETFCYSLSEAMKMGLPVVAFDLGAQGHRVGAYELGRVLPHDCKVAELFEALDAMWHRVRKR